MHFPPTQIFGKVLVPVYYCNRGPTVPLPDVARAMGIPPQTAFNIINRNREVFHIFDLATFEPIAEAEPLGPIKDRLCLGMEGICVLVFNVDFSRIRDARTRARITVAKRWMASQVANRLKPSARKNQPRWDTGLTKEQVLDLKARFANLSHQDN